MIVPLAIGDGAQGFMYLDRLDGPEPTALGQKDLNLAHRRLDELAGVVSELELSERSERKDAAFGAKLRDRLAFATWSRRTATCSRCCAW